jgi:hypothetical protein
VRGVDRLAQEDARLLTWTAPASLVIDVANARGQDLIVDYQVDVAPAGPVRLGARLDLTETLTIAAGKGWRQMRLPADCLGTGPWAISAAAPTALRISSLRLLPARTDLQSCLGTL